MACKFCGNSNPEEANFCGRCGKQLRETPLPYKPRSSRMGMRIIYMLIFFLALGAYISSLIFEADTFEDRRRSNPLKEKLTAIQDESSRGKAIDFYLTLTPEEIDGYVNEKFFAKTRGAFSAIHTELLNGEMEVALSTNLFYMPTALRIRIRPETDGGIRLSATGMSLGRVPVPYFLRQYLYSRYPWLNPEYLLKLSGIEFKEIRIEKGHIFLKGALSI